MICSIFHDSIIFFLGSWKYPKTRLFYLIPFVVLSIVFPACKPHFSWVCLSLHVEIWLPIIPSPGILVFLGWNPSALFGKTDTWCSSMSPWAGGVGSWEVSSKGRSPSLLIISFSPGSLSIQKKIKTWFVNMPMKNRKGKFLQSCHFSQDSVLSDISLWYLQSISL